MIKLAGLILSHDFVESVKHLLGQTESKPFSFHSPKTVVVVENQVTNSSLKSEKPFGNNASITNYVVNTRGINYEIAKEYLKKYYFNLDGNPSNFFGVGMAKNNEGGLNIHCGFKTKKGGWLKHVSGRNAPTIISHPYAKNYAVLKGYLIS